MLALFRVWSSLSSCQVLLKCFCTYDAFHIRIRKDVSEQVCVNHLYRCKTSIHCRGPLGSQGAGGQRRHPLGSCDNAPAFCIYICVCMYVMYVCMLCMYVCYVCMYVMYVCNVCMYVMYVMYVCNVCMYVMYVCMCVCVCMYVCNVCM